MKMTFTCAQDWNAMEPSPNGRYCNMCQKEIYDFTNKSTKEITIISNKKERCGLFRVEQIDASLKPLHIPAYHSFLKFIVATGAVLGLQSNSLTAKTLPARTKIEILNTATVSTEIIRGQCTSQPVITEDIYPDPITKSKRRKKFYLTKRFPFIVRRASHIMGRFRM